MEPVPGLTPARKENFYCGMMRGINEAPLAYTSGILRLPLLAERNPGHAFIHGLTAVVFSRRDKTFNYSSNPIFSAMM
jgi:hypothetical protein